MFKFNNILVATDTRLENHPIVDLASTIAQRTNASLTIADVVPEFPWTVRMTLKDSDHIHELIEQEKKELLEALAAPIAAAGVDVKTKVLGGKTSVATIREVLREKHDLLLRVAKGRDSRRDGFFGATGIRLLRECPCPVWLVTPGSTPQFNHVVGCVDTSTGESLDEELNDRVFELSSSISQFSGGQFSIVHAWSVYGEQILKFKMSDEDFAVLEKSNHDEGSRLLNQFLEKNGCPAGADNVHMIRGEPSDVIADFVAQKNADLVVMGTVARSGVAGIIMGNSAEQILNRIQCSVLAVKPASFKCPISID